MRKACCLRMPSELATGPASGVLQRCGGPVGPCPKMEGATKVWYLTKYCVRVQVLEMLGITVVWHPDRKPEIHGSISVEEMASYAIRCDAPSQVAVCRRKHHCGLRPRGGSAWVHLVVGHGPYH